MSGYSVAYDAVDEIVSISESTMEATMRGITRQL